MPTGIPRFASPLLALAVVAACYGQSAFAAGAVPSTQPALGLQPPSATQPALGFQPEASMPRVRVPFEPIDFGQPLPQALPKPLRPPLSPEARALLDALLGSQNSNGAWHAEPVGTIEELQELKDGGYLDGVGVDMCLSPSD